MKLLQISIALIILYTVYYVQAIAPINGYLIAVYLFGDVVLLYYMLSKHLGILKHTSYECKAFLAFYAIIFLPGLFTSPSVDLYLDSIKNGIQYAILFVAVYYVVRDKKSMDYPLKILGLAVYAFAITAYINGSLIGGRLAISESGNANATAIMMYVGFVLAAYFWNKGISYKILTIGYIPIALSNIALSGSRKGFIGTALFIALFIISSYLPSIKKKNALRSIVSFVLFFAAMSIIYNLFAPIFIDSVLFSRLEMMNDESNTVRLLMYKDAFRLFLEHPIFGIGYDNYQFMGAFGGLYTHSTYAEVLVSSGIIGTLIYFSIYVSIILKIINLYLAKIKQKITMYNEGLLLSFMLVKLFFATVTIDMYDPLDYVLLACIAGYCEINKRYVITNQCQLRSK